MYVSYICVKENEVQNKRYAPSSWCPSAHSDQTAIWAAAGRSAAAAAKAKNTPRLLAPSSCFAPSWRLPETRSHRALSNKVTAQENTYTTPATCI